MDKRWNPPKNAGSVQDCANTFGEEGVISYRSNNGGQCVYTKTNDLHFKYTINGVRSGCKPEGWGGGPKGVLQSNKKLIDTYINKIV